MCPSCGCRIKMFVPEKIIYSKKLDYFLLYVLFAHIALLLKMFQERTDYSPVDMEITSGASNTLRPGTPRICESVSREDHSVVPRNLMNSFRDVNAIGTPFQASAPRCVDSTSVRQNTENDNSFVYKFISWICVFILGSLLCLSYTNIFLDTFCWA